MGEPQRKTIKPIHEAEYVQELTFRYLQEGPDYDRTAGQVRWHPVLKATTWLQLIQEKL